MSVFPPTRWSLIARLPDQPHQAGVLLGLYADAVGAYLQVRLRGDPAERIDDIIQEVLLDLLAKPEVLAKASPGQGSRFRYYLMNLAWASARNARRRLRRREVHRGDHGPETDEDDRELPIDRLVGDLPAPERAAMDRAWAIGVIQAALDEVRQQSAQGRIEPEALAILLANLLEGQALRDIARDRGLSLAACHRRSAGARRLLQEAIIERLRLAGELGPDEDAAAACEVLLQAAESG